MEDNEIKNPETGANGEGEEKKPADKKEGDKKTVKKENWFRRTGKKIKKVMSDHPFWTAFGGAALGSAATVGVAEIGKRVVNARNERTYVQEDPNSLDPNA